jgi:hypothetical protein
MPAASEVTLPHTWRPLGVRIAGILFGSMLLVVCAFAWLGFDDETRAKFTPFQRGTIVFFALLALALGHALVRSRVVAEVERLVVVNGYRRREFEWPEVLAVHLPPGAPWATLDLADGTSTAAMGIQGSDGDRARTAVRELRRVLAARSA